MRPGCRRWSCGPRDASPAGRRDLITACARGPSARRPAIEGMTFMGVDDLLVLIPAYNEAASLPSVLAEVRALVPGADILVIDDGSSDGTFRLVDRLGVRVLRIHERIGVGGAVRTGLRYAGRLGYSRVVRVDGDGQHPPAEIDALVAPLNS